MSSSVEIKLSKVDRVYRPGESVSGIISFYSKGKSSHNGITLQLEGEVTLQLSRKSVGVFEAFYNSLKPIKLVDYRIDVAKSGKVPDGVTELPFEFRLEPLPDQQLFETYHGVFVNVQYTLQVEVLKGVFSKNLTHRLEFIVEIPDPKPIVPKPVDFIVNPDALESVKKSQLTKIPQFKISGQLESVSCDISQPFVGEVVVEESNAQIKSIEVQLVRVETCGCADGFAKESTEIQNIQVCDGDVCRGLTLPIYMIMPRLFTCPTTAAKTFKIEFEVNLVIMFEDGHLLSQNFPIQLKRQNNKNKALII
eukprot:TRINITY_DN2428_c3_g1_i1.p2 TRINITY_DN2428_c3_g1~~TRINITY_DN2428_c3_g1_i1.p2  ORF type:complete len:308 (-),score=87.01 TRINITY_DN2428_c3_g1_i1:1095-2018(-)